MFTFTNIATMEFRTLMFTFTNRKRDMTFSARTRTHCRKRSEADHDRRDARTRRFRRAHVARIDADQLDLAGVLLYLAVFGVGSIGGMLFMSGLIGLPFALTS